MSDKEIQEAFSAFTAESPIIKAFCELLAQAEEEAVQMAVLPSLDDSTRQFRAGCLAQARSFRSAINEIVNG